MKSFLLAGAVCVFGSMQVVVSPGSYRYETRNPEGVVVEEGVFVLDTLALRMHPAFSKYWHYPSLVRQGGPTGCVVRSTGHVEVFRWGQGTEVRIPLAVADHGGTEAILRATGDSLVGVQVSLPDPFAIVMGAETVSDSVGQITARRVGPADVTECNDAIGG